MKLTRIRIHNYRSIIDADIEAKDLLILVGANNAGKSNVINALRCFYDNLNWADNDFPKKGNIDQESWVELTFTLSHNEWENLADKYKNGNPEQRLILKRYFKGDKAKAKQSNIYAVIDGKEEDNLFYGAKQVSTAKCGSVVYIPALTTPSEQMKTTGPSPLREMISFMMNSVVKNNDSYLKIKQAFEEFNEESRNSGGFLSNISNLINTELSQWNVKMDLSVNPISPEEITKSLIKLSFVDELLNNTSFDLDRFGHGFQRSVIYELIRIAPSFQNDKQIEKKEFSPDFTLILFEEPEAYLHPAQQENMAYNLRRLGRDSTNQVIVTSHSPVFVSKSSDDLGQICRVQKCDGISKIYQLKKEYEESLLKAGGDFLAVIKDYVADSTIEESKKVKAKEFISSAPTEEIRIQHEKFRFQLWLDPDHASMFFADKVLLVEGASEKALFNFLLANQWYDLSKERILVVDALGKFNFHRFTKLLAAYGIPHGIMFDNDDNKNEHKVINQLIRDRKTEFTLADPFEFQTCLENYLGLRIPKRDDQKPLQILKALEDGTITEKQLEDLKAIFIKTLAITR